jgi:hypothetical protein
MSKAGREAKKETKKEPKLGIIEKRKLKKAKQAERNK